LDGDDIVLVAVASEGRGERDGQAAGPRRRLDGGAVDLPDVGQRHRVAVGVGAGGRGRQGVVGLRAGGVEADGGRRGSVDDRGAVGNSSAVGTGGVGGDGDGDDIVLVAV